MCTACGKVMEKGEQLCASWAIRDTAEKQSPMSLSLRSVPQNDSLCWCLQPEWQPCQLKWPPVPPQPAREWKYRRVPRQGESFGSLEKTNKKLPEITGLKMPDQLSRLKNH